MTAVGLNPLSYFYCPIYRAALACKADVLLTGDIIGWPV
jgi:hypothetical protein